MSPDSSQPEDEYMTWYVAYVPDPASKRARLSARVIGDWLGLHDGFDLIWLAAGHGRVVGCITRDVWLN